MCDPPASLSGSEARNAQVSTAWIPGHNGISFNELADSLANYARESGHCSPIPAGLIETLAAEDLAWAWLRDQQFSDLPPFSRLTAGHYDPVDAVPLHCVPSPQQSHPKDAGRPIDVQLCTYNAQTIKNKERLLKDQAIELGIDVLFLQETRKASEGSCVSKDFLTYNSAASEGVGGCAI